jgi:hypothetical protein
MAGRHRQPGRDNPERLATAVRRTDSRLHCQSLDRFLLAVGRLLSRAAGLRIRPRLSRLQSLHLHHSQRQTLAGMAVATEVACRFGNPPEERRILSAHKPETHVVHADNPEALAQGKQELSSNPCAASADADCLTTPRWDTGASESCEPWRGLRSATLGFQACHGNGGHNLVDVPSRMGLSRQNIQHIGTRILSARPIGTGAAGWMAADLRVSLALEFR